MQYVIIILQILIFLRYLMNNVILYDYAKFDFISYKHAKSHSDELINFSSHAHAGHEILYVVEGSPTCLFEEHSIALKPGDLLIIPPQLYHVLQVAPGDQYERFSILLFPNKFDTKIHLNKVLLLFNKHKIIQRQLEEFAYYYQNCTGEEREEIFEIKARELIFTINHLIPHDNNLQNLSENISLKGVLQYITSNIKTNISISDISSNCFLSEGHIFHLFKEHLNTTPMHYIKTKKMLLAQSLISAANNKDAITTIAQDLGYNDYSVFYRNYLSFFNHKPSDDLQKN